MISFRFKILLRKLSLLNSFGELYRAFYIYIIFKIDMKV